MYFYWIFQLIFSPNEINRSRNRFILHIVTVKQIIENRNLQQDLVLSNGC